MGHRPLVFHDAAAELDHGDFAAKLADPLEGFDQRVGLLNGFLQRIAPGTEGDPSEAGATSLPEQAASRAGREKNSPGRRKTARGNRLFYRIRTWCQRAANCPAERGDVLTGELMQPGIERGGFRVQGSGFSFRCPSRSHPISFPSSGLGTWRQGSGFRVRGSVFAAHPVPTQPRSQAPAWERGGRVRGSVFAARLVPTPSRSQAPAWERGGRPAPEAFRRAIHVGEHL